MLPSRARPRSLPCCTGSGQARLQMRDSYAGVWLASWRCSCIVHFTLCMLCITPCLQCAASFQHHPATEQHCVSSRHSLLPMLPPPQVPLFGFPWHGPPTQFSGLQHGKGCMGSRLGLAAG